MLASRGPASRPALRSSRWARPSAPAVSSCGRGRKRFEVLELNQERTFLRAEVLLIPDEPGPLSLEDKTRAIELHHEILTLAGAVQDLSAADDATLSFHLAGSLPLDLDFKQKLLGMRSEGERMQAVAAYLEKILPNLRRAALAREKAGGNGHVH